MNAFFALSPILIVAAIIAVSWGVSNLVFRNPAVVYLCTTILTFIGVGVMHRIFYPILY